MRTGGFLGVDVFVAGSAQHQPPALANLIVAAQGTRHPRSVGSLQPNLETTCRKRLVRRILDFGDGLTLAAFRQRGGAIVAVGVVATPPFQHM